MKCELVKVSHIEFEHSLLNRLWDTWKVPFLPYVNQINMAIKWNCLTTSVAVFENKFS